MSYASHFQRGNDIFFIAQLLYNLQSVINGGTDDNYNVLFFYIRYEKREHTITMTEKIKLTSTPLILQLHTAAYESSMYVWKHI